MEPDKDYNLLVGLRIREIREAFQMTRAEFSEKCDISESFLAAVESGKKQYWNYFDLSKWVSWKNEGK